MLGLLDRVVGVPSGAVDLRDRVADGAGDPGLAALRVHVVIVRVVELAREEWDRVVAARAPSGGLRVAVALEGGLITPIVRAADSKSVSAISAEMKDLAARARAKKLKPQEYQGGSAAISNLGMYGVREFAAVINPPHASILAVGAGEKRVVVKGDAPAVVQAMTVTLSVDHRVVDGALGAEVLKAFKELIENPMSMLV